MIIEKKLGTRWPASWIYPRIIYLWSTPNFWSAPSMTNPVSLSLHHWFNPSNWKNMWPTIRNQVYFLSCFVGANVQEEQVSGGPVRRSGKTKGYAGSSDVSAPSSIRTQSDTSLRWTRGPKTLLHLRCCKSHFFFSLITMEDAPSSCFGNLFSVFKKKQRNTTTRTVDVPVYSPAGSEKLPAYEECVSNVSSQHKS